MRWGALLGVLSVACATAANAQQRLDDRLGREPLLVFVAEGPANSCGPGCNRWIAVEGTFDKGAAKRISTFLEASPNLPIYFHSPGGLLAEALEIGRQLRKLRAKAGVGRTAIQQCAGHATSKDCRRLAEATDARPAAQLRLSEGVCFSACPYALIGASTRSVDAGARVGVHDMQINPARVHELGLDPKIFTPQVLREGDQIGRQRARTYLAEMGADPALLEFAAKVSPTAIHVLSRAELERFGVISKTFFETPWLTRDETLPPAHTVFKTMTRQSPVNGEPNLATTIGLTCYGQGLITLFVERELAAGENGHEPTVQVISDEAVIWASSNENNANPRIDSRRETFPLQAVVASVPRRTLELKETYNSEKWGGKSVVTKVSIAGLDASLTELRRRCTSK